MGSCFSSPTRTDPPAKIEMSESSKSSFITARNSTLYLNSTPFRFASLNAPELLDGDVNSQFEVRDTMQSFSMPGAFGRAVTRTYTLRINSKNIHRGHIKGWNEEWNDWEWDGDRLKEFDFVLAEASKSGVKLIIPIINQDFGSEDTNWVGNFADLIRMVSQLSIEWFVKLIAAIFDVEKRISNLCRNETSRLVD